MLFRSYLARQVGQKFAREIFFLGSEYSADDAHRMGMVNRVVAHEDLETTMKYTHMLNKGGLGVRSPADDL